MEKQSKCLKKQNEIKIRKVENIYFMTHIVDGVKRKTECGYSLPELFCLIRSHYVNVARYEKAHKSSIENKTTDTHAVKG